MERDVSAVIKDANEAVFVRVADFVQAHVMKAPKVEFFLLLSFDHADARLRSTARRSTARRTLLEEAAWVIREGAWPGRA
jgi:hypothetical protein